MFAFAEMLQEAVDEMQGDFTLEQDGEFELTTEYAGCYFYVTTEDYTLLNETYAWIGAYYDREQPVLSICFCGEENWAKAIVDRFNAKRIEATPAGKTCSKPYREKDLLFFNFTQGEAFDELSSYPEQIKRLRAFIHEVLMTVVS